MLKKKMNIKTTTINTRGPDSLARLPLPYPIRLLIQLESLNTI